MSESALFGAKGLERYTIQLSHYRMFPFESAAGSWMPLLMKLRIIATTFTQVLAALAVSHAPQIYMDGCPWDQMGVCITPALVYTVVA